MNFMKESRRFGKHQYALIIDYAYIIINDIYAQALQALHSIVLAEKHRGERMKKHLTIFGKF